MQELMPTHIISGPVQTPMAAHTGQFSCLYKQHLLVFASSGKRKLQVLVTTKLLLWVGLQSLWEMNATLVDQRICTTAVSSGKNSSFDALGVSPVCSIHLEILQGCTSQHSFCNSAKRFRLYPSPNSILAQLKNCQLELILHLSSKAQQLHSTIPAHFSVKTQHAICYYCWVQLLHF